jgi:hypothetical protein
LKSLSDILIKLKTEFHWQWKLGVNKFQSSTGRPQTNIFVTDIGTDTVQESFKIYQLFTGEERRIPFFFDDFHFCRSRVIGLDMTKNRIFTLCRMITWVVFLRMFSNFISSLPVKREWSLSFLVGTISNVLVMEIGWTDVGSGEYILVSCAHSNSSLIVQS